MSAKTSSSSSVEEVILDSSRSLQNTKTKQISPAKKWVFTYNNYDSSECSVLNELFANRCEKYGFQEEKGEEGTPHLQGFCVFKEKIRPLSLGLNRSIHWEKMKGSIQDNINYCTKEQSRVGSIYTNIVKKKALRVITELRPWQQSVIELNNEEHDRCDDRTINWIVDEKGEAGKTSFCKYLSTVEKQVMIITGGGYKDISCVLKLRTEDENFDINDKTTVLFNVPRDSDDQGLISYKALESLKDGLMTSTKYESSTMVFNSPTVWVFSNNMPELEKLTISRWKIWQIDSDGFLFPKAITCEKKVKKLQKIALF